MKKDILLKRRLEEERQKVFKRTRSCLVENCENAAIGSHVLQRKGILENIVDRTNHFYSIQLKSVFEMGENDTFDVKKLGIKNCYKFPGFCNKHDSEIFELIETHPIDFSNPRSLQLFAYRTVCLEYRKKEIYLDLVKSKLEVLRENFPDKHHYVDFKPAEIALKDVKFYKNEFEEDLEQKINTKFDLEIIELPLRKICFSSTLSIHDAGNEHTFEYDKYGHERIEPLASSVLNYFPYNGKSFLVAAMHKKYYCNWTKDLIQKLRDKCDIDKIISDLLTYRLELWGIAPEIFENIPQEKIEKFKLDSHLYRDNYEYSIDTEFNLFA